MKVLVTGGAGYIGSVVSARLIEAGHEVTVLDDLSTGHHDGVPDGAHFVEGGIDTAGSVLDESFDGVLHFAAKSLVAESVSKPELYWANNVCGTLTLLEAMRAHGVRRIVFSSTAATYGAPATMPITEDVGPAPTNPYGASKLAVDQLLTGMAAAHDLAAVSLRYFNVAGAYQRYGERHDPETHLIPNLLAVGAGSQPHAQVFGTDYPTRDGTAIRDYLHVLDLAEAHRRALEAAVPGKHQTYNLGTGTGYTVREVLDAVRTVTGHQLPVVESDRRRGDPPVLVASNDAAHAGLGWQPQLGLDRIVADAWAFHQTGGTSPVAPPATEGTE